MDNTASQEITKIAAFLSSMDNLIKGKFILIDIKVSEVIKKLEASTALLSFVEQNLKGFDFEEELRRAEIKNSFNNGEFKMPSEKGQLLAFVYSLLICFQNREINFNDFIRENFPMVDKRGNYHLFAEKVLIPFKTVIANEFDLINNSEEALINIIKNSNANKALEKDQESRGRSVELKFFNEIEDNVQKLIDVVTDAKKIKNKKKDYLLYILNSIIYSNKYKDLNILNALFASFDKSTKYYIGMRQIKKEIKNLIVEYYNKKQL
jgi:hypothetical protein